MAWLKVVPSLCSSELIQAIVKPWEEKEKKRKRKKEGGRSLLDLVGAIFNEVTFLVMHIRPFISRLSRSFYSTLFEFMTGEVILCPDVEMLAREIEHDLRTN